MITPVVPFHFLILRRKKKEKLTNFSWQMWVSIDDWHENPDIIHTKFT